VVVSNDHDHDHDDNSHANGTSSDKNNNKDTTAPPLRLVTAVRNADDATLSSSWPVTPTAEKVGDFRVTPAVHAGYAFTWYGLSVAGLYMTRMLWRR
jgi:cytochrome oxidase assembly protein ShyY1